MPQIFKIGSYWVYFWANENDPLEPIHGVLSNIMAIIEARASEVIMKWQNFFGEVHYYC